MLTRALTISILFALSGCSDQLSIRQICEDHAQFCSDLNTDSHCNTERADVIISRFLESKDPNDEIRYQLLTQFHKYEKCVSLASSIEHIKLKEKTTSRVNGHLTAVREIRRLQKETINSEFPPLLFYHWSRGSNEDAINKLLELDKLYQLETTDMQLKLATYFVKFDDEAAIDKLYHALELNPSGQDAPQEIYTTLVNIFYKSKRYKHAYIWALVAKEAGNTNIDLTPIEYQLELEGKNLDSLEDLANDTLSQIKSGTFKSPR
jgi:hypothetical protein